MKLRVLPEAKFTCQACSRCCHDWHVELLAEEVERVQALQWPVGDPLTDITGTLRHAGKIYLAKQPDGACVFLNPANGLCRIHEQFGVESKPLGCRLYPFQIVPTFRGEATVTGRYDCPTVRRNFGEAHADSLPELNRHAKRMQLPDNFSEQILCSFDRNQIEAICEFASTMLLGFDQNHQRALFLAFLCDWLGNISPADMDRVALARAFGPLKEKVHAADNSASHRPGLMHRAAFRTLLGLYLRRDEDVLNGRAGRVSRLAAMCGVVLGHGNFARLGVSHPRGSLRAAGLFQAEMPSNEPALFALHWQLVRTKLESLQFMGSANRGRNFIDGLRSLALLYPLVVAAAKYAAAARASATIETTDVDYAVAAIEHSFGRGAVLELPFVRSLETFLPRAIRVHTSSMYNLTHHARDMGVRLAHASDLIAAKVQTNSENSEFTTEAQGTQRKRSR